MAKKIISSVIIMPLLLASFSIIVSGGSEDDPEIVDRTLDVKLLGVIPFFPQMNYKNADWESVWFHELEDKPDNLYVSMKVRELESNSDTYDFIYVIQWTSNNIQYGASIHLLPRGLTSYLAGILNEEGNDYTQYVECDGAFDEKTNIITWIVPKESIGNPMQLTKITNIIPFTVVRFPLDSGKVKFDLFKDLPWNPEFRTSI